MSQWIFLTDESFRASDQRPHSAAQQQQQPRIIAVNLQAQSEAIDFLSPAADVGSVASLR